MAQQDIVCISRLLRSLTVLFLSLDLHFDGIDGMISAQEVQQHLDMGKKLLAAGQLADALSHYHAAIDGDPSNYMTYFRRATVYLALGKSKSAIPDLDRVLELRPEFSAARLQRANVLLKQGRLKEAESEYRLILSQDSSNAEAVNHLQEIPLLIEDRRTARILVEQQDYVTAIDVLTRLIESSPWDPELRELRAECYIAQGDLFKATGDIRPTTKLRSDNTGAFYKLTMLHYQMGEADESLNQVRECLRLDPDHKQCFPHYKKVKRLVKQMEQSQQYINEQQYEDCIEKAQAMLKIEPEAYPYVLRARQHLCTCYSKSGNINMAIRSCNDVLELDPSNTDALCDRAEAHILNEQYEEAINDYKAAQTIYSDSRRVHEGLNKANKLLKQSKKRDYYKILGVKRNASKKEIIKAYRKAAVLWHPDKYKGDEKQHAEKKFLDVAAAKEVLTDPEKRERFDAGEDPLDPENQGGHGGHPFFNQGFNPFGSGEGFQFKFHFN